MAKKLRQETYIDATEKRIKKIMEEEDAVRFSGLITRATREKLNDIKKKEKLSRIDQAINLAVEKYEV